MPPVVEKIAMKDHALPDAEKPPIIVMTWVLVGVDGEGGWMSFSLESVCRSNYERLVRRHLLGPENR